MDNTYKIIKITQKTN